MSQNTTRFGPSTAVALILVATGVAAVERGSAVGYIAVLAGLGMLTVSARAGLRERRAS